MGTRVILTLLLVFTATSIAQGLFHDQQDPDYSLSPEEFISSRDFTPQTHKVTTDDGVCLTVHRLINDNLASGEEQKPVVLLMHPLLGSSVDFMYNSPGGSSHESTQVVGNNLAFELGKRGFDVWLGNVRGNIYSSQNFTKKNWDFSLDEIIKYDLPRIIDYIMKETKVESINYIGHSQGSLIMFALLSHDASTNCRINKFIALGPAVFLDKIAPSVRFFLELPPVRTYLNLCNKFLYDSGSIKFFAKNVCPHLGSTCENFVYAITGFDAPQMNSSRFAVYTNHVPVGTSCKVMRHYAQLVRTNGLAMFDYGLRGNLLKYGTRHSPAYDLTRITLNNSISLMFGANDVLTSAENVDQIRRTLKVQLDDYYLVPYPKWNHLDFIWGKDSGKLVNDRIINILNDKRPRTSC